MNAQYDNAQKHPVKGSNTSSPKERGSTSEDASRKTRKKHHNQNYETVSFYHLLLFASFLCLQIEASPSHEIY